MLGAKRGAPAPGGGAPRPPPPPQALGTHCHPAALLPLVLNVTALGFAGDSVAKFIREPASFNTQIVALGVDTYLKVYDRVLYFSIH